MSTHDQADLNKIEEAVFAITQATIAAGKERAVFNINQLFKSLKLSRMRRSAFPEQVCDIPNGQPYYRKFGNWMIGEYGDNIYVLVKLGQKGNFWEDDDVYHNFLIEGAPVTNERRPQIVKLQLPEGMTADEAKEAVRVANLHRMPKAE